MGDEAAASRVGDDRGRFASVRELLDVVEVAEACPAVGAAEAGLLAQAALDVAAGLARLILVVDRHHALHVEGLWRVLADHRLDDRHQLRARLPDKLAGTEMVLDVARPSRQVPNDYVVDEGRVAFIAALELIEHL
ncbi:MAG TPA: hypothetical protein VIH71_08940 [Solirubrobacteraceae bacterium]